MTYGSYIVDEQAYYSERFREADEQLDEYPVLRDVFGTVSWSTHKDVRDNPVLLGLSRENRDETEIAWLTSIEHVLEEVIPELNSGEVRDLKVELAGDNRNVVMSKVLELICYHYFDSHGYSVEPEPRLTVGGETDLGIDDQSRVYLEITRLGTSAAEASIEELYESVAEKLSNEIPENKYLRLDVNSSRLVWNGQLDQSGSEQVLLEQFESAHLSTLLQHRNAIRLDDVRSMPGDWTLEDVIKDCMNFGTNRPFGENWKGILNNPDYEKALKTQASEFEGPITSAMMGDATGGLVELHSEMHTPSGAASHQERIFLERIKQKIEEKIKREQREPGKINILVISASVWLARGYTRSGHSSLGVNQRSRIADTVRSVLEGESVNELVGIVMVEDDLTDNLWIANPEADADLLEKYRDTEVHDLFSGERG